MRLNLNAGNPRNVKQKMAGVTRLELATSGVTGQRSNRMVGRARLELATNSLKGYCSTVELPTLNLDAEDGVEPSITLLQRVVLPFDHPALAIPASFYFAAARIAFIIRWAKHNRAPADATGFLHALDRKSVV